MARTALNTVVKGSTASGGPVTYTVPTGKLAIFAANAVADVTSFTVNGTTMGQIGANNGNAGGSLLRSCLKPLTANAGDVIGCSGNGVVGLSGLLYDVP